MKLVAIITLILVHITSIVIGQEYSGKVENTDCTPIEFVNIGIPLKSIGTVSDLNGDYTIDLTNQSDSDSLKFSCIGFKPYSINVKEFKRLKEKTITLKKEIYSIDEVIVMSKRIKDKTFGIETFSKVFTGGFSEVELGYEFGILMKNRKKAFLKTMNINIAICDFDSIFFRANIYQAKGEERFKNILKEPIYVNVSKSDIKDKIVIDLNPYDLYVEGDFLVTLEHVKDLGKGSLQFHGSMLRKTYIRKTSQDKWSKVPLGAGIYVEAKVEE